MLVSKNTMVLGYEDILQGYKPTNDVLQISYGSHWPCIVLNHHTIYASRIFGLKVGYRDHFEYWCLKDGSLGLNHGLGSNYRF